MKRLCAGPQPIKSQQKHGWRDGSAVKRSGCSFRGAGFHSQNLHGTRHTSGTQAYRQANIQRKPNPVTEELVIKALGRHRQQRGGGVVLGLTSPPGSHVSPKQGRGPIAQHLRTAPEAAPGFHRHAHAHTNGIAMSR